MHALLLGAGGMLGRDLVATAPESISVMPLTHAELDITAYGAVERTVRDARPEVIVNAAGYTGVDRAESEPEVAMRVNGEAVGCLGKVACAVGARVVHFSTDYVFDGTASRPYREDDPTNPLNAYGASKLAGEAALHASGAEALIIRTQWLFGAGGTNFVDTILHIARERGSLRVVRDQFGRPTYTADLAVAVWNLIGKGVAGIFHVANEGVASWFDVAVSAVAAAGLTASVEPCTTDEVARPAARPLYSVLDSGRYRRVMGRELRPWQEALRDYVCSRSAD